MASVLIRMQQVFREVFDDDELEVTDDLTADDVEEWDSLTHVTLLVQLEQEFGIRFAAADVNDLKDVGQLRSLVERLVG